MCTASKKQKGQGQGQEELNECGRDNSNYKVWGEGVVHKVSTAYFAIFLVFWVAG